MPQRFFKFRELLSEALRHDPSLWKDGELNLTALARLYKDRGAPISQPNLYRLCNSNQKPGERVVEATYKVFGIPKNIIRGEPVSAEMEDLLTQYRLSTLLLAKKLESLPRDQYEAIARQIDVMTEQQKHLRQTLHDHNVTPIDKNRR